MLFHQAVLITLILRTAIFFELQIGVHDQVLPFVNLHFDVVGLEAVRAAAEQQGLHEDVAGATAY